MPGVGRCEAGRSARLEVFGICDARYLAPLRKLLANYLQLAVPAAYAQTRTHACTHAQIELLLSARARHDAEGQAA